MVQQDLLNLDADSLYGRNTVIDARLELYRHLVDDVAELTQFVTASHRYARIQLATGDVVGGGFLVCVGQFLVALAQLGRDFGAEQAGALGGARRAGERLAG